MEAELSLEDGNLIDFFELENEESEIRETVAREQWNSQKTSLTLINRRNPERDTEFYECKVYDSNPALHLLASKCQMRFVERDVIASARVSQNDLVQKQSESFKQEVQASFLRAKDLLKSKYLYLNGQVLS